MKAEIGWGNAVAGVVFAVAVLTGIYLHAAVKPGGTVVSEDPSLKEINSYHGKRLYVTGPWNMPQRNGWVYNESVYNESDEPGVKRLNQSIEGVHILLQPVGSGPPYFHRATVSQDVLVPLTGEPEIVVQAMNINHLTAEDLQVSGCADSYFEVRLKHRLTGRESVIDSFTVEQEMEKFVFDISDYRGIPVEMVLVQRPGGECGIWKGERATLKAFYLRN